MNYLKMNKPASEEKAGLGRVIGRIRDPLKKAMRSFRSLALVPLLAGAIALGCGGGSGGRTMPRDGGARDNVAMEDARNERQGVDSGENDGYPKLAFVGCPQIPSNGDICNIFIRDSNGEIQQLTNYAGTVSLAHPVWSPDGNEMAYLENGVRIIIIDYPSAREVSSIECQPDCRSGVSWSPDKTRLAYIREGPGEHIDEWRTLLVTVNIDNPAEEQVLYEPDVISPRYSLIDIEWLTNNKIAMIRNDNNGLGGGDGGVYLINSDGLGVTEAFLYAEHLLFDMDFSPDEKSIAFTTNETTAYIVNLQTTERRQFTHINSVYGSSLSWSHNGRYIVLSALAPEIDMDANTNTIRVVDLEEGQEEIVLSLSRNGMFLHNASWHP